MKKILFAFVAMFAMMSCNGNSTCDNNNCNDTITVDTVDSVK